MTALTATGASPRGLIAVVIGNALEFYDFTVFAVFAPVVARVFFPAKDPLTGLLLAFSTFGIGFFARPLGAMLFGAYADRHGRKSAMTLTIWLMALGSGLVGLLPSYVEIGVAAPILLLMARLIQGLSVGGELAPTTLFLIESASPGRECFSASWQFASQSMGIVISGILGIFLAVLLPPSAVDEWGWRIPFLFGMVIAPVGVYLRRQLRETFRQEDAPASMVAVLMDLVKHESGLILVSLVVMSGLTVSSYFFLYVAAFAATVLHYSPGMVMTINLTIGVVGAVFTPLGGILADRYGVGRLALIPRITMAVLMLPAFKLALLANSPTVLIIAVGGLMALNALGVTAPLIPMIRLFPAAVRTAGLSIAAALGITLFGGTAQIVFTWIISATGEKLSFIWYVVSMNLICVVATLIVLGYSARSQSAYKCSTAAHDGARILREGQRIQS